MKQVNIFKIIGIIILGIIGVACLTYGAAEYIRTHEFVSGAAQVKAKVSKIESTIDSDGDTKYTAFVTYEYNGEEYKRISLEEYNSSLYEGENIELYLDKNNPEHVRIKSVIYLFPIIFISMGVIFLLVGVIILIIIMRANRSIGTIKKTGLRIYAQVKGSVADTSYTKNSKHPYRLECVYYDEASGQPVICTSDIVWESPDIYLDKYVPVYVDREDKSRYIVDLKNMVSDYSH